jgi:hypothetical protein
MHFIMTSKVFGAQQVAFGEISLCINGVSMMFFKALDCSAD